MPFVSVRILKGHSKQRKDEMSRRITETIAEVAKLPKDAVWVVFEDVTAEDWYVGGNAVSDIRAVQAKAGAKAKKKAGK
jgi:4-oxalocrotonate tautomerase